MIKFVKILFVFYALSIFKLEAQEQSYSFLNYTVDNGLINNDVHSIYIDQMNFAWIATSGGLQRFDGKEFTTFLNDDSDTTTIIDNFTTSIIGDQNNNLWIGTNGFGLELYDIKKQSFRRSSDITTLAKSEKFIIEQKGVIVDKNGNVWYQSYKGLFWLNPKSGEKKMVHEGVGVFAKSDDAVYMFTQKQILKIPFSLHAIDTYPIKSSFHEIGINDLCFDGVGNIWIAGNMGLYIFREKDQSIISAIDFMLDNFSFPLEHLAHLKKAISSVYIDIDGNTWFASGNRLFKLDYQTKRLIVFNHEIDNKISIPNEFITGIYGNKTGNLWITFLVNGFSVLNVKPSEIDSYKYTENDDNGLSSNTIRAVFKSKNDLWVGAYRNGLDRYNYKEESYSHYVHNSSDANSLSSNYISSIFIDSKERLWVGTLDEHLNYCDNYSDKELHFNKVDISGVKVIKEDIYGNIWFGTSSGLFKYNRAGNNYSRYGNNKGQINQISDLNISSIAFEAPNFLWLSSWDEGVCKLALNSDTTVSDSYSNDILEFYRNDRNNKNSIPDNRVISFLVDKNGNKWMGTYNKGLVQMTGSGDSVKFKILNKSMGISNNTIYGIIEDNSGNIWCSTNYGLLKYNPGDKKVTNFFKGDGFLSNAFYWGAYHKACDGELFFGGINGLNSFYPNKINKKKDSLMVYINNIFHYNKVVNVGDTVNGSVLLQRDLKFLDKLTLTRKMKMFSLEFTSINYSDFVNTKYAYILEGFNHDWIYTDFNQRVATYSNLPPGEYIFKVKATNNNNFKNSKITELKLVVLPFWWETRLFKAVLLLLIIGGSITFYKLRMRKMKAQKRILERKIKERTSDLQLVNKELNEKQYEIQKQNEELEASSEELIASNEELYEQKETIQSTLNELKETQLQLIQAEKMASVGTLSAGIAHEINNPLNYIQGGKYAIESFIEENFSEYSDKFMPLLEPIDVGINRAVAIVKSLNHFNRRSEDYNEKCHIHVIIDNCLIILNNTLKHNIEIKKSYTNKQHNLIGNEGELHQVILNVIKNAAQAITSKGIITINTEVLNNQLIVTVADTGCGISNENLKRVTDPFFTTKPPGEGTGLGMSISYKIIKKHKGTVTYESELNKGTKVVIIFPI